MCSENIVGKGENAGNQHFLIFTQCFLLCPGHISVCEYSELCCLQMLLIGTGLTLSHTMTTFDALEEKTF